MRLKVFAITMMGVMFFGYSQKTENYQISEEDKKEIEALKKSIPLVLANQGWEAYERLFSKSYQNWHMLGDNVLTRDEFLPLVKQWYDEGNRAIGSEIESIAFIPLGKEKVMYLHKQIESFDMAANEENTSRDIRFVSIFIKEEGEWKVDFTAFMDAPKRN